MKNHSATSQRNLRISSGSNEEGSAAASHIRRSPGCPVTLAWKSMTSLKVRVPCSTERIPCSAGSPAPNSRASPPWRWPPPPHRYYRHPESSLQPPNGLGAQLRGTGRRRSLRHPRLMPRGYQTSIGTRCATSAAAPVGRRPRSQPARTSERCGANGRIRHSAGTARQTVR